MGAGCVCGCGCGIGGDGVVKAGYILAGNRPGHTAPSDPKLTRIDLPPNKGGHRYTEYRRANGEVEAVYATWMLAPLYNTPFESVSKTPSVEVAP